MKKTSLFGAFSLALLLAAGCNQSNTETTSGTNAVSGDYASTNTSGTASNTWQSTKETGSNAWAATKQGASNAWESTKEAGSNAWAKTKETLSGYSSSTNEVSTNYFAYDYSQKDAFISEANTNLAYFDEKTMTLSNNVAMASDTAKPGLQAQLQEIDTRRAVLDQKFADVKSATESTWNDAKAAFIKAYYDLRASLKSGHDSMAAGS